MTTQLRHIHTGQVHAERAIADFLNGTIVPSLLTNARQKTEDCPIERVFSSHFTFDAAEISKFASLLAQYEIETVEKIISDYIDTGHTASNLILNLVCGAARHLGEMWCSDECSFADVTIGMAASHYVLRLLDDQLKAEFAPTDQKGSILLVTMPDDTHVFSISVLEAFFRNNGWCVETIFETSNDGLIDKVANNAFEIVGISIAQTQHLAQSEQTVKLIRQHSANSNIKVIAGGQAVLGSAAYLTSVGFDAVINDVSGALKMTSRLCVTGHLDIIDAD